MKRNMTLTAVSVIAILLATLHIAEDITRGIEPGKLNLTLNGVLLLALWLYAVLEWQERWWGLAIILFFSLAGVGVAAIHMRGNGMVGGRIAGSEGVLLWVFSLLGLGITSTIAALVAVRGLWQAWRLRAPAVVASANQNATV